MIRLLTRQLLLAFVTIPLDFGLVPKLHLSYFYFNIFKGAANDT